MKFEQQGLEKKKILLIDSSSPSILALRYILEGNNFEVLYLSNRETLFDTFLEKTPDIILIDPNFNGSDGFSLLKKLKQKHIPIIAICKEKSKLLKKKLNQIRIDDFITKPFHFIELLTKVQTLLYKQNALNNFSISLNKLFSSK